MDENLSLLQTKSFILSEFFLWLWQKVEDQSGILKLDDEKISFPWLGRADSLEMWLDDELSFSSSSGKVRQQKYKGGSPSHSEEAQLALVSGKFLNSIKLGVSLPGGLGSFSFYLNSKALQPEKIHIGTLEHLVWEKSSAIEKRLEIVSFCQELVETLWDEFLNLRLSKTHHEEYLKHLKNWIQIKNDKELSRH